MGVSASVLSPKYEGRKNALRHGKNDPEIPPKVDHATETPDPPTPFPSGTAAGKKICYGRDGRLTPGTRHVQPATVFPARLI
jgi:hypothetical protein